MFTSGLKNFLCFLLSTETAFLKFYSILLDDIAWCESIVPCTERIYATSKDPLNHRTLFACMLFWEINKQTNKKLILFNNMYRQDRYSSVTFREQIMRVWKLIRKWIFRLVFCLFLMQHSTEFWAMKQIHF